MSGFAAPESKPHTREGDEYEIQLRLWQRTIASDVLDRKRFVRYERRGSNRAHSQSCSTSAGGTPAPGSPAEPLLPMGDNHFLWYLHSYWRFEESPHGVWVESEVIALTGNVPFGLGWLIKPIIQTLRRNSLRGMLESIRAAVLARHCELKGTMGTRSAKVGLCDF